MSATTFCVLVLYLAVISGFSFAYSSNINSLLQSNKSVLYSDSGSSSLNIVESIASGAQMAMDHCQAVFKWDRWNCPQTAFSRRSKQLPTKETAYTKAIIAAGIVHAITRNCSKGEIKGCGCDPNREGPMPTSNATTFSTETLKKMKRNKEQHDWSWGGCSDEPSFAMDVSRNFLDNLEKGSDAQAFVGRHNNQVGREIIQNTMVKKCRCHGISGSCSLQTCWMQVANFAEIAQMLKEQYNKAIRISFDKEKGSVVLGNSARHMTKEKQVEIPEESLVYLEKSPDFCVPNQTNDWPGTKGRTCSRTQLQTATFAEKKSCRNLCRSCGLKVKKQKRKVISRCNCTFMWCCEVKCDTCVEMVEEYFCD